MINDLWYKNAVIYCLSVGAYMDANGDGIGDFPGLMRRPDYLHGLGVTAIWLMMPKEPHRGLRAPCFCGPMARSARERTPSRRLVPLGCT